MSEPPPPQEHALSPIGWVESVYPQKFGTPRQSGVVADATGTLHFYPPYDQEAAFEGLDGFSHLWLVTLFHLVPESTNDREQFRPRVRPPKLGGAKKVGVFASRAPYRPNRLCLSVVELRQIHREAGLVRIDVAGLDLVSGTPLLDLKPYLPYADAHPAAMAAYGLPPSSDIAVVWPSHQVGSGQHSLSPADRAIIEQTLQAQPQPAYAHADQQFGVTLALSIGQCNIRWQQSTTEITILSVEPLL